MAVPPKIQNQMTDAAGKITSAEPDSLAVAAYVGDMSLSLRRLADQSDLTFLAYLLDLVYEETTIISRRQAN